MRPAIFLDRDGVLNRTDVSDGTPRPPRNVNELRIILGVASSLNRLRREGYLLIVVTNQPDVARGLQSRRNIAYIHKKLQRVLELDDIFTCFHDDYHNCSCRKPKPGMIHQAAEIHRVDLKRSYLIGDRWSDIISGSLAACHTVLLERSYSKLQYCQPNHVVLNMTQAVDYIIGRG